MRSLLWRGRLVPATSDDGGFDELRESSFTRSCSHATCSRS
nr:hypothetical protein [Sphaerotilus sulfidivorans]